MKANVLLLPFCCDGYNDDLALSQVNAAAAVIRDWGFSAEISPLIRTYRQAQNAAEAYNPYLYDFPVLLPVTWSEPRLAAVAARQFFGMPMAVTCVGEFDRSGERTEMSSTPAAAALRGSLQEMGVQSEFFPDLHSGHYKAEFSAFAAAAKCIRALRSTKIGFFGHNFNGITAAGFDLSLLRRKFGTEIYSFDISELLKRMKDYSGNETPYMAMEQIVREKICGNLGDYKDRIIRMCLALSDYADEYGLQAIDLRCHTELSQTYGLTACLPLSLLGDKIICSCEADLPVMLTQIILSRLSGGAVSTYVDLRAFSSDKIEAGACGFAPCSLTGGTAKTDSDRGAGSGYITNASCFRDGEISLARILKYPNQKLAIHFTTADMKSPVSRLREMNCPGYPMGSISPHTSIDRFLTYVGANHYALVYGDVTGPLKYFCKYTDIAAVS